MSDLLDRLQAAVGDAYRIEKEITGGGMSRLFLATEVSLDRAVVIKLLAPELASELSESRFKQEIALAAHLQHPNILPVLTAGAKDDLLFYVMPYVPGESLRHRLIRERRLSVADALRILHEMADAVAYAHAQGVVHRDIKPENILLEGKHAVLTDFGVARALAGSVTGDRLTQTGLALGTPGYMSPEQAAGGRDVTASADVYALAVVGYEMLAGLPPFTGATAQAIVTAHLTAQPRPLAELRSETPTQVADAIMGALSKESRARPTVVEFRDAIGPTYQRASDQRWSRTLLWGAAAAAAIVVVGGLAIVRGVLRSTLSVPSASAMAIVPFAPSSPDTALARLGRDLVVTLSANLDGVGDIRTIDALTVLARTQGRTAPLSLREGVRLARDLGASSVVHGSVVRAGDRVRLDLGLFTSDSAAPVARVSVSAPADSLVALTDSATWALLREVWRSREPPTPSLGAVTTRSVPALRAFLEGEGDIIEDKWQAAAEAFSRAMAADSTFWLAYRRYVYARAWIQQPYDASIVVAYQTHRFELPERERLMIEAPMTDSLSVTLRRLEEITRRFPDYWPGQFAYADALTHWGTQLGHTRFESQAALERTLALNSNLTAAWQHLFWVSCEDDTATAVRALASYARRNGGLASLIDLEVDDRQLFDALIAARRGRRPPSALLDSMARSIATATRTIGIYYSPLWLAAFGAPDLQVDVDREVARLTRAAGSGWQSRRAIVSAWIERGAWDSAMTLEAQLLRESSDPAVALEGYRTAAVGVWLGALDRAQAGSWRPHAAATAMSTDMRAEIAWLDGLVAVAGSDLKGVQAARARLKSDTGLAVLFDRSLAAFELDLSGNRRQAGRAMAALEWQRAENSAGYDEYPYLIGVNRLAAARWLALEGDTAQAGKLLAWTDGALPPNAFHVNAEVSSLVFLERARLEAPLGHIDRARVYYEAFLRRYDRPTGSQRQVLEDAKTELARLYRR